jgi:hypothetical protein
LACWSGSELRTHNSKRRPGSEEPGLVIFSKF